MKKLLGIVVLGLLVCTNVYAKCIKGNCKNGFGIWVYPDGTTYEGNWKNHKFEGLGSVMAGDKKKMYYGIFIKGELVKYLTKIDYYNIEDKYAKNIFKIPTYVHIVNIKEHFAILTTPQQVKYDFYIANKVWAQAGINWEIKEINYIKPNLKYFTESRNWIKKNCKPEVACVHNEKLRIILAPIYEKLIRVDETL
jgi:hypothetical protein